MAPLYSGAVPRSLLSPPVARGTLARVHSTSAGECLRVLFVTPRFFPFLGGVENHVYEIARRMAGAGVEVTVLTANPGGRLSARETLEHVNIVRVPAYPADRDYYFAPGLYRAITRGEWDVVHVQSYHTLVAPLAMLSAWRAQIPYVVTFHGGGSSSHLRNAARHLQQWLLRPLLARAERLVALAEFEEKDLATRLRLPFEKFVLIPNGADLPRLSDAERPAVDPNLIASVGRLERYKGHQRAIAALPHVLERRPEARLWIAGKGPYEAELRRLAADLGVADRVRIAAVPPNEREEMARQLSRVALVVLFSEYETHPIAILEALSLGRPAVVAKTSGLGELVERGYARGVELDSTPQETAAAMVEQLDRPFAPNTMDLPSWDTCAQELLDIYRSVVWRTECAF